MLNNLLPTTIYNAISEIDFNLLNEIKLRNNKPIIVNITGKYFYLTECGVSSNVSDAIICSSGIINNILGKVSNNSLYAINDQLINGYVSYCGGVRIGVSGEVVSEKDVITTIKNITTLNIRIPHLVKNCSLNAYSHIVSNHKILSTLIMSEPGAGKTTFIRDLVCQLAKRNSNECLLVVDERGEISGNNTIDLGNNVDVVLNSTKKYSFENGIRSLNPSVIITDEINLNRDLEVIEQALTSGVSVIATLHAKNIEDLKNKKEFINILKLGLFERFVVLNKSCGPGTLEGIYNQNLNCIYC